MSLVVIVFSINMLALTGVDAAWSGSSSLLSIVCFAAVMAAPSLLFQVALLLCQKYKSVHLIKVSYAFYSSLFPTVLTAGIAVLVWTSHNPEVGSVGIILIPMPLVSLFCGLMGLVAGTILKPR